MNTAAPHVASDGFRRGAAQSVRLLAGARLPAGARRLGEAAHTPHPIAPLMRTERRSLGSSREASRPRAASTRSARSEHGLGIAPGMALKPEVKVLPGRSTENLDP